MAEYVKMGRTQLHLHCMTKLVTGVSNVQRTFVMDIRFNNLLSMKPYMDNKLPQELTWWLVSKVDLKEGALKLGGESFNIKASIPRLLGLPQGCNVIQPTRISDDEEDEELLELKRQFTDGNKGKGLVASAMLEDLKGVQDRDLFCRYFILLALCFYLAPTNNATINRDYLTTIRCVDEIKDFNWSKFVAEYLISGIKEFREKVANTMHGCVHILHLIYFDYKQRTWNVRSDTPLIHLMEQSDLNALEPDEAMKRISRACIGNPSEDEANNGPAPSDEKNIGDADEESTDVVSKILKDAVEEIEVRGVRQFKKAFYDKLPHLVKLIRHAVAPVVDPDLAFHEREQEVEGQDVPLPAEVEKQDKIFSEKEKVEEGEARGRQSELLAFYSRKKRKLDCVSEDTSSGHKKQKSTLGHKKRKVSNPVKLATTIKKKALKTACRSLNRLSLSGCKKKNPQVMRMKRALLHTKQTKQKDNYRDADNEWPQQHRHSWMGNPHVWTPEETVCFVEGCEQFFEECKRDPGMNRHSELYKYVCQYIKKNTTTNLVESQMKCKFKNFKNLWLKYNDLMEDSQARNKHQYKICHTHGKMLKTIYAKDTPSNSMSISTYSGPSEYGKQQQLQHLRNCVREVESITELSDVEKGIALGHLEHESTRNMFLNIENQSVRLHFLKGKISQKVHGRTPI